MNLTSAPAVVRIASRAHRPSVVSVAAAAAAVAGLGHLVAMPAHFPVSWAVGLFFLTVGCAQVVLAAVLVIEELSTRAKCAVALAHLALIGLYVASRTRDLPFVPLHTSAGHVNPADVAAAAPGGNGNGLPVYPGSRVEPVGALDVLAVAAELVLVVALLAMVPARARGRVLDVAVVLGAGLVLLRLTR